MKKLALALLIIFIGLSIWYHVPTRHQLEMQLSTFQGENKTATIFLDVKKHKSFINPTVLSGSITYDGRVYESYNYRQSNAGQWKYKLQQKLNGELAIAWFYNPKIDEFDLAVFEADGWSLQLGSDNLEQLMLGYREDGQYTAFAGHASNEQEAVKLMLQLFGHE